MIQFNWSFCDFSNFGEISRKMKLKAWILGPSSIESEFCVLNRFFVCLSETQYLQPEIE